MGKDTKLIFDPVDFFPIMTSSLMITCRQYLYDINATQHLSAVMFTCSLTMNQSDSEFSIGHLDFKHVTNTALVCMLATCQMNVLSLASINSTSSTLSTFLSMYLAVSSVRWQCLCITVQ